MDSMQMRLSHRLSAELNLLEQLLDRASMPRTKDEQEALADQLRMLSAKVRKLRRLVGQRGSSTQPSLEPFWSS